MLIARGLDLLEALALMRFESLVKKSDFVAVSNKRRPSKGPIPGFSVVIVRLHGVDSQVRSAGSHVQWLAAKVIGYLRCFSKKKSPVQFAALKLDVGDCEFRALSISIAQGC